MTDTPLTIAELLPCPFCGGKANIVDGDIGERVECAVCGARSRYTLYKEGPSAISRWNTRTTMRAEAAKGWKPIESKDEGDAKQD